MINPGKSEALTIDTKGRVITADDINDIIFTTLQPLLLRDRSAIRWLGHDDQTRYLGTKLIGGGRCVDGGTESRIRLVGCSPLRFVLSVV